MRNRLVKLAVISSASLVATSAFAGTWTGAVDSDWNNAANWSGGVLPAGSNADHPINTAGPGVFPVISADSAFTPVDIRVGMVVGTARLDHVAGTAGTGAGNWMLVGFHPGAGVTTATYNLADTAASGGLYTGYGTGSGSMNVSGNLLAGLDAGTVSTINVNTTGTLSAGGGIFVGGAGASGAFNIDNGTVNVAGEFQVGGSFYGNGAGTNTYRQSGGTVTANVFAIGRGDNASAAMTSTATVTGGTLNAKQYFSLGFAGSANHLSTLDLNGGTINVNTAGGGNMELGVWDPDVNVVNLTTGALNVNNNAAMIFGALGHTGSSTFNQNGGTVTFYSDNGTTVGGGAVIMGDNVGWTQATGTYTYNLNGGSLTTGSVSQNGANANATFNFNGGQLVASGTSSSLMSGLDRANVRNGGAILVVNHDVTVAQPLLHSNIAGDNAKDGGLMKMGNSVLTLGGVNTYTGDTLVLGGSLVLADNAALSFVVGASGVNNKVLGAATLYLDGDLNIDLSAAATTLGSSWLLVDVASLNETFGTTFSVAGFTEAANVWTADANGARYQFSESTGILEVIAIPEPATALLGLSVLALRRSRKA